MSEGTKRRLVDRVIDPAFLEGMTGWDMDALRTKHEESYEAEKELSFERRLCQARIDILSAELDQRTGKMEGSLIDRLPEILADESRPGDSGLPERAPDFSIPRNADVPRRRIEEIEGEQALAQLSALSSDEIKGRIGSLKDHERAISDKRQKVQAVVDELGDELKRRYAAGEADPASIAE
ncbi:MAG: hypothetical protein ACRDLB_11515 [Actinomycetota bacterium]